MRRTGWLLALALLVAPGCNNGDTGASGDATDAAPTAVPDALTIRDVDFATLRWRDAMTAKQVRVSEPNADPAAGPIRTIGEELAYADADDDGDDDALVPLAVADGNGSEQVWYVWTWDAESEAAVQVENPIARESRCGDDVVEVRADPEGGFAIRERLRDPVSPGTCADPPTIEVDRTVALADNWPVLRTGIGGFGGICPQPRPGDSGIFPIEDIKLYAGPRPATGRVEDPQLRYFGAVDTDGHRWLIRPNWSLMHFLPHRGGGSEDHFDAYGDYIPCAWAETGVDVSVEAP